jgi:hypothetical protein
MTYFHYYRIFLFLLLFSINIFYHLAIMLFNYLIKTIFYKTIKIIIKNMKNVKDRFTLSFSNVGDSHNTK